MMLRTGDGAGAPKNARSGGKTWTQGGEQECAQGGATKKPTTNLVESLVTVGACRNPYHVRRHGEKLRRDRAGRSWYGSGCGGCYQRPKKGYEGPSYLDGRRKVKER